MKLIIIYGGTDGQTRKIAGHIKSEAEKTGADVFMYDASSDPPGPEGFDGAIIGSSIRNREFQSTVEAYILHHLTTLNTIPSVLFTVSSAAIGLSKKGPNSLRAKGLNVLADRLLKKTKWNPLLIEHIAGAVKYTIYPRSVKFGFWLTALLSGLDTDTSKDYEYTDWKEVTVFAQTVCTKIKEQKEIFTVIGV